jgi:hypothetical protein
MTTHDFTDPDIRDEYFRPSQGRPSDDLLVKTIYKRVAELRKRKSALEVYESKELCIEIWERFPDQHVYMGHRIKALIADGKLSLIKADVKRNNHVLYLIVDE